MRSVNGVAETEAAEHTFQVYLYETEKLSISLPDVGGTLTSVIRLNTPDGSQVAIDAAAILDYTALVAGIYQIVVTADDANKADGINQGGQGYRAYYSLQGNIESSLTNLVGETEPNDSLAQANQLVLTTALDGSKAGLAYGQVEGQFSGDANRSLDNFKLDLQVGDSVTLSENRLGGNVDAIAKLRSSSGATVAENAPTAGGVHLRITH